MKTLQVPSVNNVDQYWFDHNPALTHFMSALSVLFPDGERFFMKCMNAYRTKLPKDLQTELNEFCMQEANHGRVHTLLNTKLDTSPLLRDLENETKAIIDKYTKYMTKKQKLAVTVCLEHLTAVMGKQLVVRDDMTDTMTSDIKDVWLYHAAEEVEHAHVSFDIYKAVGGGYLLRSGLMIPCIIALALVVGCHWYRIMKYDKIGGFKNLPGAINVLFGRKGFITEMDKGVLAWFKPNFHPHDIVFK